MPPKTLTAEQVAEIDRKQQQPQQPVSWQSVIPQKEDVLTYHLNREAARQDAPAVLDAGQTDAAEAQASVAAETSFGRAMGAEPNRSAGPQAPGPKKFLSASEVEQADYERVSNVAYLPTKDEWKRHTQLRQKRDSNVGKFLEAGKAIGGSLIQAAAATAYAPFDFVARGTKAYDEWVNSSAEGLRQASISTAELWSWTSDLIGDSMRETERVNAIDSQLRQRLAAENKFTGNAQADAQIFAQAREQAMASGLYAKSQDEQAEDEDTQYQRFIRDRSLQQQSANITETNIGTMPDSRAEMGIDASKLNPGLVTLGALAFDPLNIPTAGLGALNKVRLLRRVGSLAGEPLRLGGRLAGGAAQKAENLYSGIVEGVESATGVGEAGQAAALSSVSWKAAAAMATLKGSGRVLRKVERGLNTGSILAKEIGIGGVGVSRVEAAGKLRNAPIPERYRRAYDGFFTSADSTLRRVSETPGLSPIARRSAATLDRIGATQAFRIADDAVSGAVATAPIAIPLAVVAPEERRPEILGSIMTIGAGAGVIGGKVRRLTEADDALVAKMLADAEISGGDATSMANMLPHDKLVDMAQKTSVISAKADLVPLRAVDYELNTTVKEAMGLGTRGVYVEASKGQRPRIFINLDKAARGDVTGHEIGHAIMRSDILGGEIKQGMRAMADQQYGTDGVAARGREYVNAQLTQEVRDGTTGIQLSVLKPDEVARIAAARGDEAAEKALTNEFIRERWANDPEWKQGAINDRVELLNQEALGRGNNTFDWARDEIAAETFSGLGNGLNLSGVRASGPLGRAVGAASAALEAMGARMKGNGRLETPNRLFVENPLFNTPEMRKAVNNYVKLYDRYLVGLEKEGKIKQRGTPIAPTGKASDAIRSPHTKLRKNGKVVENDLFIQRPDGTVVPKSQQMLDTQEKARAATIKSINDRTKFVNENSSEWGARKLSNGRVEVGGPNLPPQFDYFVQIPEYHRQLVRQFEAGRSKGQSYLYSINVIGTGESGRYKVSNYGNIEAKTGEMVPFGAAISTKNHVLIKAIDLNSFRAAAMRAIDNEQLGEFGNDLRAIQSGLKQLLKNYEDGKPGETGLGVTKKNILNGLLGTGTVTQRASNQAWHTLNNQGSVRTYRLDRINYAEPYDTGYFPHYNKININALPDGAGAMSMDNFRQFDADRMQAWMSKRAAERGFANTTNWQNADPQGFLGAEAQYRQEFPMPDAAPRGAARGQAMPDGSVSGRSDGMPDRKAVQQRAKQLGLPANWTTKEIAELVRIAEKSPYEWTQEEFATIAPHLSIHQDLRPGSNDRVKQIMERGLPSGMVDSVGNWVDGRHTWAHGQMAGDNAYLFISEGIKYRGKGNPWLAEGNMPIAHIKTKPGQTDIYEALIASRPQAPQRGQAMPDDLTQIPTDQLLRQYEENQGYLGLSTLGMREGRPVRGGAAQTRELLRKNEAITAELDRRGQRQEDPQLQRALQRRGQAMPDVTHSPNYALPSQVPSRGHFLVGATTRDGRKLEYKVDPRAVVQPPVKDINQYKGENVMVLEADRYNTVDGRMGGPLHPWLISNQVVARTPDGTGYKVGWANMAYTFVSGARNKAINNTDSGRALIQVMADVAHRSGRDFVSRYMDKVDAVKSNLTAQQKDSLHVLLELGARMGQKEKLPTPQAKFVKAMATVKSQATRGKTSNAEALFKKAMQKHGRSAWFREIADKFANISFSDEAAGFTFPQRAEAMDKIDGLPFLPSLKDDLSASADFVGAKNLDVVASVQLSQNPDAFAVYFGKNPAEDAKMTATERNLRDQFLANKDFRVHPSYDWMMLSPENADNFILEKPVALESLFPWYRKAHPKASVKNGSPETVAGAMRKYGGIKLKL